MAASTGSPTRWAVLVGIDQYSAVDPLANLEGSVNDVVLLYGFLRNELAVPKSHIKLHLASLTAANFTPSSVQGHLNTKPTRANFLSSLDLIESHSNPGDFLLIHFSGHGKRQHTRYDWLKSSTGQDELLCFLDEEHLSDVDFGGRLEQLVGNKLIVLVTLDCCFSGGATRISQGFRVRCMPESTVSASVVDNPDLGHGLKNEDDKPQMIATNTRNATIQPGYLYRPRQYNVIAACQEYDLAWEGKDTKGNWHGVLTHSLVDSLRDLGKNKTITTYLDLRWALEASVRKKTNRQQPVIIGEQDRILFESRKCNTKASCPAHIVKVKKGQDGTTFELDKGAVSGVMPNDIYEVRDPKGMNMFSLVSNRGPVGHPEIIILSVGGFSSEAKFRGESGRGSGSSPGSDRIKEHWLATLKYSSRSAKAQFLYDQNCPYSGHIERLKKYWTSEIDPLMPVNLSFSSTIHSLGMRNSAHFNIELQNNQVIICDNEKRVFDHLPPLSITSESLTETLMYRLKHLCAFFTVKDLITEAQPLVRAEDLTWSQASSMNTDAVSSWCLEVKNRQSRVMFVTVLNLTPLYGINQVLPPPHESKGYRIQPGDVFKEYIDIIVPSFLSNSNGRVSFTMTDILKVFITSEEVDLTCHELDDINQARFGRFRHAKSQTLNTSVWQIEDKEIPTYF